MELTWEEKLKKVDESGLIGAEVWAFQGIVAEGMLTRDEYNRLGHKLEMVEELAYKLVLNMIKGTLKYNTDDWTMAEWLAFGIDDAADSLNYWLLTRDKYAKERTVHCCQA
jgi:hypothetical protein